MSNPLVIAVDGPAASGKGTVAAALARHYGLPYLDTGVLYRAVGFHSVLRSPTSYERHAIETARRLTQEGLDQPEYRTREVGEAASLVAAIPEVRAALLDFQRRFASQAGGAVLDGRDIGTVIAPRAPAKLFVTATPEVRAMRRWKQLTGQGEAVSLEEVLADIARRDERDSGRAAAPLVQAEDAALLDTSEMTIEQAFAEARRLVEQALGR
jgi:cytidylate kinase